METKALLLKEELINIIGGDTKYIQIEDFGTGTSFPGIEDFSARELEDLRDLAS